LGCNNRFLYRSIYRGVNLRFEKLNDPQNHIENSEICSGCDEISTYYGNSRFKYPIKCKCNGFVHCDTWGFDDGQESATYYNLQCEKCKNHTSFMIPDDEKEYYEEIEGFLK